MDEKNNDTRTNRSKKNKNKKNKKVVWQVFKYSLIVFLLLGLIGGGASVLDGL